MTRNEINDIADTLADLHARISGDTFVEVVETLAGELSKYGPFDPNEFRRRCYSA